MDKIGMLEAALREQGRIQAENALITQLSPIRIFINRFGNESKDNKEIATALHADLNNIGHTLLPSIIKKAQEELLDAAVFQAAGKTQLNPAAGANFEPLPEQ